MARAGSGFAGGRREDVGGPRRADGKVLRLDTFAKRAAPDVELDTERTDIRVCLIAFLAGIPSEIPIQSGLPSLLELLLTPYTHIRLRTHNLPMRSNRSCSSTKKLHKLTLSLGLVHA